MNKHLAAYKAKAPQVIVDLTVPSGFTFKFEKPSKYSVLFRYAQMPQALAGTAASAWIEQGLIKPDQTDKAVETETAIQEGAEVLRRICELSVSPKLVVGEAVSDDQFSTDWLDEPDTEFLIQWVQSGGNIAAVSGGDPGAQQLGNFPEERGSNTMASASRKKRGNASK